MPGSNTDREFIPVLKDDRRIKPFIRSGKRRKFDRRESYRLGTKMFPCDVIVPGMLQNISDSGACLSLKGQGILKKSSFEINLKPIYEKNVKCYVSWEEYDDEKDITTYGIKFTNIGLKAKRQLRNLLFLNETHLMDHANAIMDQIDDELLKMSVMSFFTNDIKSAVEAFIEIDEGLSQKRTISDGFTRVKKLLDGIVNKGDVIESALNDNRLTKEIKNRVRLLVGYFIYQGRIMRRGLEKPRGYPGDYIMLESIYDNITRDDSLGSYCDRYFLENPYADAVRNRKDMMRDEILKYINKSKESSLSLLNLASGSCRELQELFAFPISYKGNVNIIGVDLDLASIEYSKKKLKPLTPDNFNIDLVQGNIVELEKLKEVSNNSFDIIYSIGIADYLQDRLLSKIFHDCYNLLKPGGKLIVAYKDKLKYKPLPPNWYCDWYFVPRGEPDFIKMVEKAMGKDHIDIKIVREPSEIIFFAVITKKANK
ncbi:MAG: methyltransferase domain-containing protein [Candidatus Theseobacter exili]|nr:methyltransferase domain-containing protein [Candidatus Theseobacter exili]